MAAIHLSAAVVILISTLSSVYSVRLCLVGNQLVLPQDGNQVVECGSHETCYLEQYVTPNGLVQHKAGCKDTKFCGTGSVADPNIGVCSECCDQDLCAPTLCGNSGWPQGSGPICYHCANPLSDPTQCSSIQTCSQDEVCGVNADGNGKYIVQCMSQTTCNGNLQTSTCASCCSTQLCNFNCTQQTPAVTPAPTTTPTPTTPKPTTAMPTTATLTCVDDPGCASLYQTFHQAGEDVCQKNSMKYFCNKTCSLCPGMTTPTTTLPPTTTQFDACSIAPCDHGVCSTVPSGTFQCTCDPGFVGLLCDKHDPCTIKPCQHGTCASFHNGTFVCTCDAGYNGVLCEKVLGPCSSNPCQHGSCFDNGNTYQCTCQPGYLGPQCDVQNPCQPSPCVHGVCSPMNNGSFTCVCSSGYSGTNCDTASGPCTNSPCVHGTCLEVGSSFVCVCDTDYIGDLCDKQNPCLPSPCHNGTCSIQSHHVHCTCDPGFTGVLCDTEIITCASFPQICHHGSCQNVANNVKCLCNAGWTGHTCNKKIRDCKDVLDFHHGGHAHNSVEIIELDGHPTNVFCDQKTAGGGWTVLMNRDGDSQHFPDKTYTDYETGFGEIHGDFWAGLEKMYNLTSDGRRYQLRVELQVANGTVYVANYDDFSIGQPDDFVLHIGSYHGNAGDSLSGHDGFGFTTKEVDHDSNAINCGWYLQGAWWFHTCYDSCLTCPYETPGSDNQLNCRVFSWNELGYCIALKSARMMMKPM